VNGTKSNLLLAIVSKIGGNACPETIDSPVDLGFQFLVSNGQESQTGQFLIIGEGGNLSAVPKSRVSIDFYSDVSAFKVSERR
jgi:hypothetical protein